jgi:ribonuclease J
MSFDIKKHEKDLLFIPIGGTNKVGLNLYVYHYKGKFLIVDFGCGFADDSLPGVDITVPDISFLVKHKKNIVGIVLTHAHEDHVGALQHLWNELECNVYATPFTSTLLKERFLDNNFDMPGQIVTINLKEPIFNLEPFKIELVPMCHAIPEMHAVLIKTEVGNIFHTGDWKFDKEPLIGKQNDEAKLKKYGDEGILAVVGDSTNVFNTKHSGSEGDLKRSLTELIKPCKKMVVVAMFSSNLARFETLIDIANFCDRKIVLSGRNLRRIFDAGLKSGYLKNSMEGTFVDERDIKKYNRNKLLVIATGCQGEQFASVTKIANQMHRFIDIEPEDTVIFSSKIIPGNDARLYRVFDKLVSLKVDILMEKTAFTHVSGHSSQGELKRLYKLLRPKVLVPIHGEQIHLYHHVKLAPSLGVDKSILISDGDVIKFKSTGSVEKIGKVKTQELAVYGNYLYTYSSPVMNMRRKMKDGICMVVLFLSDKYELQAEPVLMFPGFLEEEHEKNFIDYIKDEIIMMIHDSRSLHRKKFETAVHELEKKVKSKVKGILKHEVQKVPVIQVIAKII